MRSTVRTRFGVLVLAIALLASACGGSDSDDSDSADAVDTSSTDTGSTDADSGDGETDTGSTDADSGDGETDTGSTDADSGDGETETESTDADSGDGETETESAASGPDTELIFFDPAGNTHLDPHDAANTSSLSQEQLWAVYDRLVHIDDGGFPVPGLASSFEYNDDLTQMTFVLREDVTFSNGEPFNADVVVANFDRMREMGDLVSQPIVIMLGVIESYEATGEYEVVVTFNQANGQMPFWFSQQGGMMVAPASIETGAVGVDFDPVGTGPFTAENFISLDTGTFARNDNYWGGGVETRPAVYEHHYVTEGQARLNAVQSGQATMAIIDASQIPAAEAAGLEVQINTATSLWNFAVNSGEDRVTGDQRVRQAIMHAIDREGLVDALTFGSGAVTNQLLPPGHPVHVDELDDRYPFDPDKSRELLAEAGYGDGVRLDWILLNTSEYLQLGEAIQAMLAEVGIEAVFNIVDISEATIFRDPVNPQGDVMMTRWGGRPDPLITFQELTGPTGTYSPKGAIASPLIAELIDEASSLDPSNPERLSVLRELNAEITEQAAIFPVMTRSNIFVYQPGCISNFSPYFGAGDDIMNDIQVGEGC